MFDSMLERIKKKEADGIVVVNIDRLARNWIEAGFLSKLIDLKLLKIIRTPYKTYENASDLFMMGMEFLNASQYSRNLSIRVKEGIQTKLLNGDYPSNCPIGYVNKNLKVYLDPTRSKYIKRIFDLYETGSYSVKDVSTLLYEEGLRSRKKNRKVFPSVIHKILKDSFYLGDMKWDGKIYKGNHKPLISREQFNNVQDRLLGKTNHKKNNKKFIYRGYLVCDVCGCRLTATHKKEKHDYYYCTDGKNLCDQHKHYLKSDDVKKVIGELFKNIIINKDLADLSLDVYGKELINNTEYSNKAKESLEAQLMAVEKKINMLLDIRLEGSVEEDEYNKKKNSLRAEKLLLEEQIQKLPTQDASRTLELLKTFKNGCYNLGFMFLNGDDDVRGDLLKSALWNANIKDAKIASYQYKKLYAIVHEADKSGDFETWRREQDLNLRGRF